MKVQTSLTHDNYNLMELTKYFKEFHVDYDGGGCTFFQNSHLDFFSFSFSSTNDSMLFFKKIDTILSIVFLH